MLGRSRSPFWALILVGLVIPWTIRPANGGPYVTEAYDLADPTDNDPAQQDMVEQTAQWVEFLLDLVAGPPPGRRARRDRVPGVARALQWSRHRAARGASR